MSALKSPSSSPSMPPFATMYPPVMERLPSDPPTPPPMPAPPPDLAVITPPLMLIVPASFPAELPIAAAALPAASGSSYIPLVATSEPSPEISRLCPFSTRTPGAPGLPRSSTSPTSSSVAATPSSILNAGRDLRFEASIWRSVATTAQFVATSITISPS